MNSTEFVCVVCSSPVNQHRWELGYHWCKPCGEASAKRIKRTVVPMHKSNYILVTNLEDLKGINNKGGFYR
jgi:ribosomal protein L37AE/L43A